MQRRTFFRSTMAAAVVASFPRRAIAAPSFFVPTSQDLPDVVAVRGDGSKVTIRGAVLRDLRKNLRGKLLLRSDAGYEDARMVLNPSINKRPAFVVQPTGVADIRSAVNVAREFGLLVAVKCGGHSFSGQSTCDDGMQIDLSNFRAVHVDPAARRVNVAGGTLLGQVDHETLASGLVTPLGTVSHTGVGGLTTGGGFGRLARKFGLAIDNLASVDLVTADGALRHASATDDPDLFWGVRGGGGNFGIVTNFEFRLHPFQRQVVAGDIVFPLARAKELLDFYGDFVQSAPDDLYVDFTMVKPPGGGEGVFQFSAVYAGNEAGATRALAPLRKLGTPLQDSVRPMDYAAVQRSGDVSDPRAVGTYLKSGFISRVTPDLFASVEQRLEGHPNRTTLVFSQHCGGAISRVAAAGTAFAQRDAKFNLLSVVAWRTGDDPGPHIAWERKYWEPLERYTSGWYVNEVNDESSTMISANYRENHRRLVTIKNKYDPTNLFRLNANVQPSTKA